MTRQDELGILIVSYLSEEMKTDPELFKTRFHLREWVDEWRKLTEAISAEVDLFDSRRESGGVHGSGGVQDPR